MDYILELNGLTKHYEGFTLDRVGFALPYGAIMGLVGENGAGKSTTIGLMLNLLRRDGGEIRLFGREMGDADTGMREAIGVVFDENSFYDTLTPRQLDRIMARGYARWDSAAYRRYLERFELPEKKEIKQLSRGMKVKLNIAVALSHRPELLILDEATSSLDPVVRDELLDLLLDFVQDERHGILLSSHLTGDLEKIADYITFLHQGQVVFSKPKDELMDSYGILKCGEADCARVDPADILARRRQDYSWQLLVADRAAARRKYPDLVVDAATVEDIMLLYAKGERV